MLTALRLQSFSGCFMKFVKIFLSHDSPRRSTTTSYWCECTTWNDPFLSFKLIHLIRSFQTRSSSTKKWTAFYQLDFNWTPWKLFPFIKPTSRYMTVFWLVGSANWLSGLLRSFSSYVHVWGGVEIIIGTVWRNHNEKQDIVQPELQGYLSVLRNYIISIIHPQWTGFTLTKLEQTCCLDYEKWGSRCMDLAETQLWTPV